jgi:hypothetical protein
MPAIIAELSDLPDKIIAQPPVAAASTRDYLRRENCLGW